MADLIVKAAVKEQLEGQNVASDFYDTLDEEVATVLENAAQRAEEVHHRAKTSSFSTITSI